MAQRLIMAGQVRVDGQVIIKPAHKVNPDVQITISQGPKFVSRGGEKLAAALEATGGKAEGLPEALRSTRDFPGLLGEFSIDAFGDVHRDLYIMRVEDGKFVLISVVSLTP